MLVPLFEVWRLWYWSRLCVTAQFIQVLLWKKSLAHSTQLQSLQVCRELAPFKINESCSPVSVTFHWMVSQWTVLTFIIIFIHAIAHVAGFWRNRSLLRVHSFYPINLHTEGLCFLLLCYYPFTFPSVPDWRCGERGQTICSLPGAAGSCSEVGRLSAAHAPPASMATYVERGSVRWIFFSLVFDYLKFSII